MPSRRIVTLGILLVASPFVVAACGVRSKRDLNTPAKEITYSDACNLQAYFDERANAGLAPPIAADELLAQNDKGQTIGEGTYVLKDNLARRRFARLLRDEYSGLDARLVQGVESTDGVVTVHVRWWDAGPIHRVRPDDDVVVSTPNGEAELPPNVCVSDFLFGDKVYAMRARYVRNEVDLATDHPLGSATPTTTTPASTAPPPATTAPATSSSAPSTIPSASASASTAAPPSKGK